MSRDLVRNAADRQQVAHAKRKVQDRERRLLGAWRAVLGTPEGRVVLFDILGMCKVHETISVQNSLIYTLSGRRDVGLEVMARCVLVDEELHDLMARESRAYERRLERENAAAHQEARAAQETTQ